MNAAAALILAALAGALRPPPTRRTIDRGGRMLPHRAAPANAETERAVATLSLVTCLWGSQHAVTKAALDATGDGALDLTATRFAVAAILLAPWFPRDAATWRAGLELGLWSVLGFGLQTARYPTARRAGLEFRRNFAEMFRSTPGSDAAHEETAL